MHTDSLGKPEKIDFDTLLYFVLRGLHREANITTVFFRIENQAKKPFYNHAYLIARVLHLIISYALRVLYGKNDGEIIIRIADQLENKVSIQLENKSSHLPEEIKPYDTLSKSSSPLKLEEAAFVKKKY